MKRTISFYCALSFAMTLLLLSCEGCESGSSGSHNKHPSGFVGSYLDMSGNGGQIELTRSGKCIWMSTNVGEWETISSSKIKVDKHDGGVFYGTIGKNATNRKTLTVGGVVYTRI